MLVMLYIYIKYIYISPQKKGDQLLCSIEFPDALIVDVLGVCFSEVDVFLNLGGVFQK